MIKYPKTILGYITVILLVMTQCKPANKYPEELDKLVPGSSLIIKGKVLLLHTNTTDEEDVTNTGVVEVTEVMDAPEAFKNIVGQQITIRFNDINKIAVGEERMFFTEPYWAGESMAVTEIGSILKSDKMYADKEMGSYVKQARVKQEDVLLTGKLSQSKLVVTGKVTKINIPEANTRAGTEHDPEWKEVEIQVDEMLKGKEEGKTMKVLFASSKDVMFFQSPKLNPGDEGIFLIEQTDSETVKFLRNDKMIITPGNFIKGKENTQRIKSLLK